MERRDSDGAGSREWEGLGGLGLGRGKPCKPLRVNRPCSALGPHLPQLRRRFRLPTHRRLHRSARAFKPPRYARTHICAHTSKHSRTPTYLSPRAQTYPLPSWLSYPAQRIPSLLPAPATNADEQSNRFSNCAGALHICEWVYGGRLPPLPCACGTLCRAVWPARLR